MFKGSVFPKYVQPASSVVSSCKYQNPLIKSELPSSERICGGISGWPPQLVPSWLPTFPGMAIAKYTFANACLYPDGVLYTLSAVISFVGVRSNFFVHAEKITERKGAARSKNLNIFFIKMQFVLIV